MLDDAEAEIFMVVDVMVDDVEAEDIMMDDVEAEDVMVDDIEAEDIMMDDVEAEEVMMDDVEAEDVMVDDVEKEDVMVVMMVKKGICPSQCKMWSGIGPESRSLSFRVQDDESENVVVVMLYVFHDVSAMLIVIWQW